MLQLILHLLHLALPKYHKVFLLLTKHSFSYLASFSLLYPRMFSMLKEKPLCKVYQIHNNNFLKRLVNEQVFYK
nr:MAG TPA: hypothetical protein [Caudoviricetes sp.]